MIIDVGFENNLYYNVIVPKERATDRSHHLLVDERDSIDCMKLRKSSKESTGKQSVSDNSEDGIGLLKPK